MKTTIKAVLVLALFCGTAIADNGDMGNGGFWAGTTVMSAESDGDMGNGGKTCPNGQTTCRAAQTDATFDFLSFVSSFFASGF